MQIKMTLAGTYIGFDDTPLKIAIGNCDFGKERS